MLTLGSRHVLPGVSLTNDRKLCYASPARIAHRPAPPPAGGRTEHRRPHGRSRSGRRWGRRRRWRSHHLSPRASRRRRRRDHALLAEGRLDGVLARQRPRPRHEPVRRPRRRAEGSVGQSDPGFLLPGHPAGDLARQHRSGRAQRGRERHHRARERAWPVVDRLRHDADPRLRRVPPGSERVGPGRPGPHERRALAHDAHRPAVAGRLRQRLRLGRDRALGRLDDALSRPSRRRPLRLG